MSITKMGDNSATSRAHEAACNAAEAVRQVAVAAATTQAAARTAEITYYRAALSSAITNKCSTDTFLAALRELGVSQ